MTSTALIKNAIYGGTLMCLAITFIYLARVTTWRNNPQPKSYFERITNESLFLSPNSTTLVTALYDIGRGKEGRSMEEYLQWMEQTLQLDCPFIIYTSRALAPRIRGMRRGRLAAMTVLIERDHIPLEDFADLIETCIFPRFRSHMRHPQDITNRNKLYSIVNHAKMVWISEAIAVNPFHTETIFWIDAGSSRFIRKEHYKRPFPSSLTKVNMLVLSRRAFVGVGSATDQELNLSRALQLKDIVGTNKNFVRGFFWGGHCEAVRMVATQTLAIFFDMLSSDMIDNEQISLFYAYRKRPELFALYKTQSVSHAFDFIATE